MLRSRDEDGLGVPVELLHLLRGEREVEEAHVLVEVAPLRRLRGDRRVPLEDVPQRDLRRGLAVALADALQDRVLGQFAVAWVV